MKKTALIIAALVSGCATTHTYQASPQAYRAKGQENQTHITGKIEQKYNNFGLIDYNKIVIFFDGQPQITGTLDAAMTGEFVGDDYQGKKTAASCSTKPVTKEWGETKCIIFIDNERAATLTM